MELNETPVFERYSHEDLKDKLKFYTRSTISKYSVEINLECIITDKEYKKLLEILYG